MKNTIISIITLFSLSFCSIIPGIDTINGSDAKKKLLNAANSIDRISIGIITGSATSTSIVNMINSVILPAIISIDSNKYYDKESVQDCVSKINSITGLILGGATTLPLCDIKEASFIDIGPIDLINGKKAEVNNSLAFLLLFGVGTDTGTGTGTGTGSSTSLTVRSVTNSASLTNTQMIPGATIRIDGTGFSTTLADNTVTVGGTVATVFSATNTLLQFTMPEIASITENKTVSVVVTKGTNSATGSITYFPTPTISLNTANSISRTISILGSHWYKFTTTAATNIVNVSGYTGRDIDLFVYSSPSSGNTVASATTNASNTEFLLTTHLTPATTYHLEVRMSSSTATTYNIAIASQAVSGGASCSLHPAFSRCFDYLYHTTASQTDCTTNSGTYTVGGTCAGLSLGPIVGKCTYPSATNIGTMSYYSNGTTAFSALTAQTTCNGVSRSIFQ